MNTLNGTHMRRGTRPLGTVALFIFTAVLAATFFLFTGSSGLAGGTCTFCHKRTQTMMLPCSSLQHQRHVDHGDTTGPCAATRVAKESTKKFSKSSR